MKHYILVYIPEPPEGERTQVQAYQNLLGTKLHKANMQDASVGRIGENVWLLERESAASALARIVSLAEDFGIDPVVRFLSEGN